jgi:hypothetical protein
MRRQVALLLIALGGCVPDQPGDMAACQEEVKRFYPVYVASNINDPGVRYIMACMEAKGYDFSISAAHCDSKYPLPTQPACYTPQGSLAAAIDQLRRPAKSN